MSIYSKAGSSIKKVAYMYVVNTNYFMQFPNFRFLSFEIAANNVNINYDVSSPTYNCSFSPGLSNTTGTFVGSFYGLDLVANNTLYKVDISIKSLTVVSTTQISFSVKSYLESYNTTVKNIYLMA